MGFLDGDTPEIDAINIKNTIHDGDVNTDVPDIKANAMYNNLPVFDVDSDDFNNNLKRNRNMMVFKDNTNVGNYLKQTKTRNEFYLRSRENGYMRKVTGR
jgi:hypothetical protein